MLPLILGRLVCLIATYIRKSRKSGERKYKQNCVPLGGVVKLTSIYIRKYLVIPLQNPKNKQIISKILYGLTVVMISYIC